MPAAAANAIAETAAVPRFDLPEDSKLVVKNTFIEVQQSRPQLRKSLRQSCTDSLLEVVEEGDEVIDEAPEDGLPTLLAKQRRNLAEVALTEPQKIRLDDAVRRAAARLEQLCQEEEAPDSPAPLAEPPTQDEYDDAGECRLVVKSTFLDINEGNLRAKFFQSRGRAKTDSYLEAKDATEEDYCPGMFADSSVPSAQAPEKVESASSELPMEEASRMEADRESPGQCAELKVGTERPEVEQPCEQQLPAKQRHPQQQKRPANKHTTVMMRNLPNNYTREMLLEMLDGEGFFARYDFLYLPMDFDRHANLGYAFVNLVDGEAASDFWKVFDGFSRWMLPTSKVCQVSWSGPHQGRQAHVDRYKNSPVMHFSVPDEFKPMLFQSGIRQPFPPPSRKLRPPNMRPQK
eukprot:gb/GFBE01056990.1/.p1 GENE.gb/GFBE01056990.1/~~gb/GFBE01056990.1/.p1  ORF type:complete len:404 (+),score=107.01 gb/GFBE01056990.1/:1-1212(+)